MERPGGPPQTDTNNATLPLPTTPGLRGGARFYHHKARRAPARVTFWAFFWRWFWVQVIALVWLVAMVYSQVMGVALERWIHYGQPEEAWSELQYPFQLVVLGVPGVLYVVASWWYALRMFMRVVYRLGGGV